MSVSRLADRKGPSMVVDSAELTVALRVFVMVEWLVEWLVVQMAVERVECLADMKAALLVEY